MSDESQDIEELEEVVDESESPGDADLVLDESETERKRGSNLVYAALGAGALVLALLLLVVWLSSRNDDSSDLPLCLDISTEAASDAVLEGEIESLDVLIDQDEPLDGLTAIQLRLADGECRRLPEGADNRDDLYQLLGVVSLYNEAGEQQVDVRYLRQDVPGALMNTSTPIPTETPVPTETLVPTETPVVSPTLTSTATAVVTQTPVPDPRYTATAVESPEPTIDASSASPSPIAGSPTSSPAISASPLASPVASPAASAVASPST